MLDLPDIRKQKGYKQDDLALALKMPQSTYAYKEKHGTFTDAEQENISHKLTDTRRKEIRRKFEKVITGYKITIHDLTPFHERIEDVPVLIKRKKPKNDL